MIFGFPARYVVLAVTALALIGAVSFFTSWVYGRGVSAERARWQETMRQAEIHAQNLTQQRDEALAHVAQLTASRRTLIALNAQRGHDEIAAVTPATETPIDASLVGAWAVAVDRLRVYPAAAPESGANPSGSSAPS